MRHATSEGRASSDHARALTPMGEAEATDIGQQLRSLGWAPEAALSSDATRTRMTWACLSRALEHRVTPHFTRQLYLADYDALWSEAHHLAPTCHVALALGHNPGWEVTLHALAGQTERMTPATAALLIGEGDTWPEALEGRWRLEQLLRPRPQGV